MQDYFTIKQIADLYETTIDAVRYKVRKNKFPACDTIVGKSMLWEKKTIIDFLYSEKKQIDKKLDKIGDVL